MSSDLKFTYLAAKNFLCFGPEGFELDLSKYGNIVLISGENLDVEEEEEKIASNGAGKSTVLEILIYTLFGKTIKYPKTLTHSDVINNKIKKNLMTEVRWSKYRVVRTRKPDSLRIWESENGDWNDDTEISVGGIPTTQKVIEDKIKLTYDTFVNIVAFTNDNRSQFLECDTPNKRKIVENLLNLEIYRKYGEAAKKVRKELVDKIKLIGKSYEHLLVEYQSCVKRVEQVTKQESDWKILKQKEIDQISNEIKTNEMELRNTDEGTALLVYEQSQTKLANIQKEIPNIQAEYAKYSGVLSEVETKLDLFRTKKQLASVELNKCQIKINDVVAKIATAKREIQELESTKDTKCSSCHGIVKEENFKEFIKNKTQDITTLEEMLQAVQKEKDSYQEQLNKIDSSLTVLLTGQKTTKEKVAKLSSNLNEAQRTVSELSKVAKPDSSTRDKLILYKIEQSKQQLAAKQQELVGPSPYVQILEYATVEMEKKKIEHETKKAEMIEAEAELPYYDFWVTGFGDNGIRKFVIDGIIPSLNNRIAYWMQYLIDGKIRLKFDNQLEATIDRIPYDGDEFVYHAMSGGERQRLNLSVSQSFAYIRTLNSTAVPSVAFLDEVATNIDPIGIIGVYNMIVELAKEKQVFIITHDRNLLELLDGCETINLVKKDGFTTLKH